MFTRQISKYRIDSTFYTLDTYPIVALSADKPNVSASEHKCIRETCPFTDYCPLISRSSYPEILQLKYDDIVAAFPMSLKVPYVYWMTMDEGLEKMFVEFPMDDNTCAFAVNEHVALLIQKNNKGFVSYIGFDNLRNLNADDVPFILYLAHTVQSCTSVPLYFCPNRRSSLAPRFIPLNSVEFEQLIRKASTLKSSFIHWSDFE